ncbi:MAG: RHS repeat-associated core domain-containing protein [Myxococcota bacterium]
MIEPNGGEHRYTYDDAGKLVSDDGPEGKETDLEKPREDTVVVTSAGGRVSRYQTEWDKDEQTRTITHPGGYETVMRRVDGTYRDRSSPDGTIVDVREAPDPRFSYQAPYAAKTTVKTGGHTLRMTRDIDVDLESPEDLVSVRRISSTTTVNGDEFRQVYDGEARTWQSTSAEGRETTTYLDEQQRVERIEVPGLAATSYEYDEDGRVSRVLRGSGASQRVWTYRYHDSGNAEGALADVVAPNGDSVGTDYNASLLPTQVTANDDASSTTNVDWEHGSDIAAITPPGRQAHTFEYDLAHRPTREQPPDVGANTAAATFEYDVDGLPTRITRADGTVVDMTWSSDSYELEQVETGRTTTTFDYDDTSGQLAQVTRTDDDGQAQLSFEYAGMLPAMASWSGPVSASVERNYDDYLRVSQTTVNGAHAVDVSYTPDGLPDVVGQVDLGWDDQNAQLRSATLAGALASWEYNAFAEPTRYTVADPSGGSPLFEADYVRDSLGRITERTETVDGTTRTWRYSYDGRGRLTDVERRDGGGSFQQVASYTWGPNNNRTAVSDGRVDLSGSQIQVDARDRLTRYGSLTYDWDAAGDLTRKTDTSTGDITRYDYDASGNLQDVELPDGRAVEYRIGPNNRRIGRVVHNAAGSVLDERYWVYRDALNPIAELDAQGNVTARFVYASRGHVPDYMIKGGTTYRLITDHLGSVRLVVDANTGNVAQKLRYDAFGRVLEDTNPGFQPFGYAGGLYDPATGLVRFGARDYDPDTGRWTASDPIGFAGGDGNLYAYVGANPVNLVDPSGLSEFAVGFSIEGDVIAPILGDGGGTAGVNVQYTTNNGLGIYTVRPAPDIASHGVSVGASLTGNIAWSPDGGVWTGPFDNYSVGPVTYFEAPETDQCLMIDDGTGWTGWAAGPSVGTPSLAYSQTVYERAVGGDGFLALPVTPIQEAAGDGMQELERRARNIVQVGPY